MQVVYPICCGIDVHKTFLVATINITQEITLHYSERKFSTRNLSNVIKIVKDDSAFSFVCPFLSYDVLFFKLSTPFINLFC